MRGLIYLLLFLLPLVMVFGWDSGQQPGDGSESLLQAAEAGDLDRLDALLAESESVDLLDNCRWTPLMKAALNGHREVVRRLLDKGADVNAQDKGGYTALMLAASNNHAEIVRLLSAAGADVDHVEQTRGWTALIWSAANGHRRVVETLLQLGADPQARDYQGMNAAEHARAAGHRLAALAQ